MNDKPSSPKPLLFDLGNLTATRGALALLDRTETNASALLYRHASGDWSEMSPADAEENLQAITIGSRVFSAYGIGILGEKLWVITEADRSVTTLLLPEEY